MTVRIFIMREKLDLLCINLVSMPYVGGNEYNLIESDKVKTKFVHGQGWKRCLLSNFILWIVKKSCRIQYKIIIGQEVHTWIISKSHIPPLREELHVEENIFLKDYVEIKEQNIEISKEIN